MNGTELLRIVDAIHRDKNIDKEIVFEGVEQAIASAGRKHFGDEEDVTVHIDRETGQPTIKRMGEELPPEVLGEILGRIAAQTAKQVMIQKIREAERDALYDEYTTMQSQIVTGAVSRVDGGAATVNLGKVEGLLPRGEQIPGESHRVGERVRAVVLEVKKSGSRVRIILSRAHPDFVRRLFELEIPEVAEHVIEVRSLAREAGYRSKVAVSCYDSQIDAVGACVGVRGSRIKSIVDELGGERIDIVRWNDSLQVLVPNALQPAEVEDVILCPMLGKVIVLVRDDQLSLAIGKKGQNVRLASKLVGWDIQVMTQERLDEQLDKAVAAFSSINEVSDELAENLVAQGFFTFDDLSVIEPDQLAELGGLSAEDCDSIIAYADTEAARLEREEELARQAGRLAAEQEAQAAARSTEQIEEAAGEQAAAEATGETAEQEAAAGQEEVAAGTAETAEPVEEQAVETTGEQPVTEADETGEPSAVLEEREPQTGAAAEEENRPGDEVAVAGEETAEESPSETSPQSVDASSDEASAGGEEPDDGVQSGNTDNEDADEALRKAQASAADD